MDRENVIKTLIDALTAKENYPWAKAEMSFEFIEMLLELLKEQPEIVRCKNCIWFHKPDAETKKSCKCNYHGCVTEENKYCWWGEKDG